MTQHKNDEDEYEELTDLDLPLELTEEEREICKMIVDSAKPIKNYSLWKIKRSILFGKLSKTVTSLTCLQNRT